MGKWGCGRLRGVVVHSGRRRAMLLPKESVVDLVPSQPAVLTVSPASLEGIVEDLAA
jgi:hypothetical protein